MILQYSAAKKIVTFILNFPGSCTYHLSIKGFMHKLTTLLLAVILILSACIVPDGKTSNSSADQTSFATTPVTETAIATATIIWFPVTATWTPIPSIEPSATPQYSPGMGAILYQDDFNDPDSWSFAKTESSGDKSIIINRNRLTLAVNAPPVTLYSINNNLALTDFYAEITVSVNRCFGPDTYGLLFRTASGAFTYRYLLNCSGKTRVEQVREYRTLPLLDWTISGDAPVGAPGLVKMGVWTAGTEMRFFLNGRYQFTLLDPLFKNGSLGVFVNSTSPDGMNISFSELTIHSIAYVSPTPSATPSKTPTPSRTPRSSP